MFAVGALYLLFEKSILVQTESTGRSFTSTSPDGLSRGILGAQVRRLNERCQMVLSLKMTLPPTGRLSRTCHACYKIKRGIIASKGWPASGHPGRWLARSP